MVQPNPFRDSTGLRLSGLAAVLRYAFDDEHVVATCAELWVADNSVDNAIVVLVAVRTGPAVLCYVGEHALSLGHYQCTSLSLVGVVGGADAAPFHPTRCVMNEWLHVVYRR
jgi:hypothetical protein